MMSKRRKWADPVDAKLAEQHFSRFVRYLSKKYTTIVEQDEATAVVASPTNPPRRVNESTSPLHQKAEEPSVEEISKRRLLGQEAPNAQISDEKLKSFLVEIEALQKHKHFEDVKKEVEKVRSLYPNDVQLHGSLADFFLKHGDLSRSVEILFSMVTAYFERADPEAAKRCLKRISSLDPKNKRLNNYEKLIND